MLCNVDLAICVRNLKARIMICSVNGVGGLLELVCEETNTFLDGCSGRGPLALILWKTLGECLGRSSGTRQLTATIGPNFSDVCCPSCLTALDVFSSVSSLFSHASHVSFP